MLYDIPKRTTLESGSDISFLFMKLSTVWLILQLNDISKKEATTCILLNNITTLAQYTYFLERVRTTIVMSNFSSGSRDGFDENQQRHSMKNRMHPMKSQCFCVFSKAQDEE